MKIAVYAVARDEEYNVKGWYESSKEADYHLILDTGSTDNTISLAKSLNINVLSAQFNPWDESLAKNVALSLLPKDIDYCILLDLDQRIVSENWRQILIDINAKQYDAINHKLIENFDSVNNSVNVKKWKTIHNRNNCYWHKYRPRLSFYSEGKETDAEIFIESVVGNLERYKDRDSVYLKAWEREYFKITKESDLEKQTYLCEIIAHQAFNFFEINDLDSFFKKQEEFMFFYNSLNNEDKGYLVNLYSSFLFALALLFPGMALEALNKIPDSSIYKKNALLKQNIIMYWLNKEDLVEELKDFSVEKLIYVYSDTKTGEFKTDLGTKSYHYFINKT